MGVLYEFGADAGESRSVAVVGRGLTSSAALERVWNGNGLWEGDRSRTRDLTGASARGLHGQSIIISLVGAALGTRAGRRSLIVLLSLFFLWIIVVRSRAHARTPRGGRRRGGDGR
jgi:hypothetical protein